MIRVDRVFDEPLLEFGGGGHGSDIREGIARFGPVDTDTARAKVEVRGSPSREEKVMGSTSRKEKEELRRLSGD